MPMDRFRTAGVRGYYEIEYERIAGLVGFYEKLIFLKVERSPVIENRSPCATLFFTTPATFLKLSLLRALFSLFHKKIRYFPRIG